MAQWLSPVERKVVYPVKWVSVCAACWPKFIRRVSVSCDGRNWGILCKYWLYLPTTTVHQLVGNVDGQPQYGQPSVTSRQCRPHARDQRPWHSRSAHPPPAQVPVTNRKAPLLPVSLKRTQANPLYSITLFIHQSWKKITTNTKEKKRKKGHKLHK